MNDRILVTDTHSIEQDKVQTVKSFLEGAVSTHAVQNVQVTFRTIPLDAAEYMGTIKLSDPSYQKLWEELQQCAPRSTPTE